MTSLKTGTYTVSKSLKDVLRSNLDSALSTLGSSEGVADYLPPDLQVHNSITGSNVYLSDRRNPPQAKSWILGSVSRKREALALTIGTSNSEFEVVLLCGVRQFRRNASTSDPVPFASDAGWQVAGLLAQACAYVLRRYLAKEAGIYNLGFGGARNVPLRPQEPAVYEVESRFSVWSRTKDPFLE